MTVQILKKFKEFSYQHLRLSSFLFLLLPCVIYRFFVNLDNISTKGVGVKSFILAVFQVFSLVLVDTVLASIPIFLIVLLFNSFLKQKSASKANWSFFSKFTLASFPSYFVMFFAYLALASELSIVGILIIFVYSAYFAIYLALLSEVSKIQFVLQCIFVMPLINFSLAVTAILVNADIKLV